MASLACVAAAALAVAPAASAQQGSARDQYQLDLPNATGSDRQPGPPSATGAGTPASLSPAAANRLAATGRDDTGGVVVWVLALGVAAISCAGGLVAYRRRRMADQTP